MSTIIGRKQEIEELERLYGSDRPEFVAVYGRRRVGKTFLIKQALKGKFTFQHTGVSPVDQGEEKNRMKTQLESFYYSMLNHGLEGYQQPKTWMEAFFLMEQLLQKLDNGERMVIFIDELPWMDTPRSQFLPAFEHFWNGWCNDHDNVMLIVCGSATTWMLKYLSRNKNMKNLINNFTMEQMTILGSLIMRARLLRKPSNLQAQRQEASSMSLAELKEQMRQVMDA